MRIPFFKMFMTSPFEGLQEHAEKVMECAWAFQQAIECYFAAKCKTFEEFRQEVTQIESQADAIKRRIRGHIPKRTMMPISNFLVFRYLKEQDEVLDAMEDSLDWISYRSESRIPQELEKDFSLLVDAVIDPIEQLNGLVVEARLYFKKFSETQRVVVKNIIHTLRLQEHEADKHEDIIKKKVFNMEADAVTVFHLVRLAETIGSIADHAQNAGDMMRAMLSR
ncbi:MAG: TIGR00153 family protein [Desulfobacterales bacterium]